MKKIQLPSIGGIRKVIKVGNDTTPGTTIVELGSASITLAQLRQLLGITSTPSNPSGTATPVLTPGPGLQGGGPLVGNVQLRLTAPGFIDIEGGGSQGEDGAPGPAGARGPTGAAGPAGPALYMETDAPLDGDPGPPGPPGSNGATGAQGPMGPPVYLETDPPLDGDPGPPGPPGSNGATGAQGPQGVPTYLEADPGLDGDMGPPGRDGAAGATGAQGPQGVPTYLEADPGLDGDMGPPGRDGAAGAPGAQGVPGAALFFLAENGDDGERGPPGQAGVAGANGAQGPGGPPGLDGEPGVDGDAGPPGPPGPAGAAGTQSVTFLNAAVNPDTKPLVPQTIDDEFDVGSSIDTAGARRQGAAGWAAFSLSTGSTAVNQGYLRFAPALTASRNFGGYSVPLSGAFDVRAKLTNWNQQTNSLGGIALATSSGASGNIMIFGLNNTTYVVQRLTNATTFSANAFTSASGPANGVPLYLRITSDLTNLRFYASSSGIENTFVLLYTEALATFIGTVAMLVVGADNEDAGAQSFVDVDWVRDYTAGYAPATSGNGIGPPGPAIYLEAEAGQDGDIGPPGQPGVAGATGAQGPATIVYYPEIDFIVEDDQPVNYGQVWPGYNLTVPGLFIVGSGSGTPFSGAMAVFRLASSPRISVVDNSANQLAFGISGTTAGFIGTVNALPMSILVNNAFIASFGPTGSNLEIQPGTTTSAPLRTLAGTNLTTPLAGAYEYDGVVGYFSPAASNRAVNLVEYFIVAQTGVTLVSQTAAQKMFNSPANGRITLPVGAYEFECDFSLSAMSASSGSFGFALGGTATKTQAWWADAQKGTATLATATATQTSYNTAANTALTTASVNTVGYAKIRGMIFITVAGTIIPQVSLGVAAAAVVGVASYFRIRPVGVAGVTNVGHWS